MMGPRGPSSYHHPRYPVGGPNELHQGPGGAAPNRPPPEFEMKGNDFPALPGASDAKKQAASGGGGSGNAAGSSGNAVAGAPGTEHVAPVGVDVTPVSPSSNVSASDVKGSSAWDTSSR